MTDSVVNGLFEKFVGCGVHKNCGISLQSSPVWSTLQVQCKIPVDPTPDKVPGILEKWEIEQCVYAFYCLLRPYFSYPIHFRFQSNFSCQTAYFMKLALLLIHVSPSCFFSYSTFCSLLFFSVKNRIQSFYFSCYRFFFIMSCQEYQKPLCLT